MLCVTEKDCQKHPTTAGRSPVARFSAAGTLPQPPATAAHRAHRSRHCSRRERNACTFAAGEIRHIRQTATAEERDFCYNTAMSSKRHSSFRLIIPKAMRSGVIVIISVLAGIAFLSNTEGIESLAPPGPLGDAVHLFFLFGALVTGILTGLGTAYLRRSFTRRDEHISRELGAVGNKLGELEKTLKPTAQQTIIDKKMAKFLNIPAVSFHYADRKRIEDFYHDYFRQPVMKTVSAETTGELHGTMKGSVPKVVEVGVDGKNTDKTKRDFDVPEMSLSRMFLDYQSETIRKGQVLLAIEEVDAELTEIGELERGVANFEQRYGFTIDELQVKRKKAELRLKAANTILDTLEQVSVPVLIEGKFSIERDGKYYTYVYTHPVTQYLTNPKVPVTISVRVSSDAIEEPFKGNYSELSGRLIPLQIYGTVLCPIDRAKNIWDLRLTPLAIY